MYWRVMNEAWEYLLCDIVRNTAYTTGGRIRYLLVLLQDVLNEENGRACFWALDSDIINAPNFWTLLSIYKLHTH